MFLSCAETVILGLNPQSALDGSDCLSEGAIGKALLQIGYLIYLFSGLSSHTDFDSP
jgi:hypothetical protein